MPNTNENVGLFIDQTVHSSHTYVPAPSLFSRVQPSSLSGEINKLFNDTRMKLHLKIFVGSRHV